MSTRLKLVVDEATGIGHWYNRSTGELFVQCAYSPVTREHNFCAPPPIIPNIEDECGATVSDLTGIDASDSSTWSDYLPPSSSGGGVTPPPVDSSSSSSSVSSVSSIPSSVSSISSIPSIPSSSSSVPPVSSGCTNPASINIVAVFSGNYQATETLSRNDEDCTYIEVDGWRLDYEGDTWTATGNIGVDEHFVAELVNNNPDLPFGVYTVDLERSSNTQSVKIT